MDQELTLRVTDLARGGAGTARTEQGQVVFIPFTAPGDLVRVRITGAHKRYLQAEVLEILEPSPQRQKPPCPVFTICGGCQWQHIPYDLQWKTKVGGVQQSLKRVGISDPPTIEQIPAEQIWEYRNRIQLRGDSAGHHTSLGFYKAGTHEVVSIDRCEIARAEINQQWEAVRNEGARFNRPFKVEMQVTPEGDVKTYWNGSHAAGGFQQVHDAQNEKLKQWIFNSFGQYLGKDHQPDFLLDLFGGFGNLSIPFIETIQEIHCVDTSAPERMPPNDQIHYHRSPVLQWLLKQTKQAQSQCKNQPSTKVGAAILDPPRIGLGHEFADIAKALHTLGVRELVMVGCDPDSWARDLSRWIKRGWILEKVMVIDLFPQTIHVESVAVLRANHKGVLLS